MHSFLDEPTSGLDSQSSWGIVAFLRTLADNGQAVLATIHQPSAILFQEFDRLLFLAKGGKTVYFGDIGHNSRTLLDYFEKNGSRECGSEENPAEFMLETVGAGPSGKPTADWHGIWKDSPQSKGVQEELDRLHAEKAKEPPAGDSNTNAEFAMPFGTQVRETTHRVFQQYWRTPGYGKSSHHRFSIQRLLTSDPQSWGKFCSASPPPSSSVSPSTSPPPPLLVSRQPSSPSS